MIVVITGASSGIGRATALEFAKKGASVVLAARRGYALNELVNECAELGGKALAVTTNVTSEEEINTLANQAIQHFGHFDVWVNNAAVSLFGHFDEIPTEDIRQLMEVNVFGYLYGARAAIRHFKSRGQGTLINVSSMSALAGQPYSVPYSVSKFAVRGLNMSLAQELADQQNIHICGVLPAVIDTPIFQHAANYMGKRIKAPEPVIPASDVAKAIVKLTKSPKEEIAVGNMARFMRAQRLLLPLKIFDKNMQKMISQKHFKQEPSGPYKGNLYEPITNWNRVNGGWRAEDANRDKSSSDTVKTMSAIAGVLFAGLALGTTLLRRK